MKYEYGYYPFKPTVIPPVVFVVAFLIVLAVSLFYLARFYQVSSKVFPVSTPSYTPEVNVIALEPFRRPSFIPSAIIALGLIKQVAGYVGRIIAVNNLDSNMIYIVGQSIVLIAPSFLACGIYLTFSKIKAGLEADHLLLVRHDRLITFFVSLDAFSGLLQGSAGGILPRDNMEDEGRGLAMAGFALQYVTQLAFIILLISFLLSIRSRPTKVVRHIDSVSINCDSSEKCQWRVILWFSLGALVLTSTRSVLKMVEYYQIPDGTLWTHEITHYVIDGVPLFVANCLLTVFDVPGILWRLQAYRIIVNQEDFRTLDESYDIKA